MICERCGLPLAIGEFGCIYTIRPHAKGSNSVIGDDIPGGFVQEHFGATPETFYSKKAMLKRADQLGLKPYVRHTDGDTKTSRWI